MSCPPFWSQDPRILIDQATEFFPFTSHDQRCTASALNSFTRFGIYLGILLALVRLQPSWLLIGVVFAGLAFGAWFYMDSKGSTREGFADTEAAIVEARDVDGAYVPDIIGSSLRDRTEPTAANPFMNVLVNEISENPTKPPAANVDSISIKNQLDDYFQTMFASDPGDTFQHTQSQRQFVTMPSTTIPNDQESFQNWLYRVPGQTCKEGNYNVCYFDTGDAALPWRDMHVLT
jgi:hypothetical protein